MTKRSALRVACAGLFSLFAAWPLGCARENEVILRTGADRVLSDAELDADPWALLPSQAVALAFVDTRRLFDSALGRKLLRMVSERTPLPPSAGFELSRDLSGLYVGVYSMQGADVAMVAKGRFDRRAIEDAVEKTETTPLGVPLLKSQYAGRTLYTADTATMTVLTDSTLLLGNDTGLRRALDRLQEGKLGRALPRAFETLMQGTSAPMMAALDLRSQPISNAARKELAFLNGLHTAQLLGNFEPPGVNLAGTLSYESPEAAAKGASNLQQLKDSLQSYAWLMALVGIEQPVKKLEAQASDKDTRFVVGIDERALGTLLDRLPVLLGTPGGKR